jgi:hypothetical protein
MRRWGDYGKALHAGIEFFRIPKMEQENPDDHWTGNERGVRNEHSDRDRN